MISAVSPRTTEETLTLAFCLVLAFVGVFNRELDYTDETRVTAIALEMSRDGNLVVPHLGGSPFVEKPPMYFAAGAVAFRLFGDSLDPSGVMRLTSVLWGLGCVVMTLLLARRLAERRIGAEADALRISASTALLTATVLMTTVGFASNMHYIRADIALAFFVVAAVWAFAEVYLEGRYSFLSLASVFLAGAFLCKGLIGVALIGIAWSGLAVPWFVGKRREAKPGGLHLAHHFLALGVFLLAAGSWVALLRGVGGESLWNEWFWRNQFGRFLGNVRLGHEHPGRPFYYLLATATYTLPWFPLIVVWFWRTFRGLRARRRLSRDQVFLLVWCLGSLVLLTLSSTKRRVYLLPLLPAYALIGGEILGQQLPRLFRLIYNVWIGVCVPSLVVLTLAPALYRFIPDPLTRYFNGAPAQWSLWNLAIGVGVLFSLIRFPHRVRAFQCVGITALAFIGFYAIGRPLVEGGTELRAMAERFVVQVDRDRRPRTAGSLSESMRGLLYIHAGWAPRQIDRERFQRIIQKRDPDYDSVITNKSALSDFLHSQYRILAQATTEEADNESSHRRRRTRMLRWVTGRSASESAETAGPTQGPSP